MALGDTTSFILGDDPSEQVGANPFQVQVTLTEVDIDGDGETELQIDLQVLNGSLPDADLRGLFLNLTNDALLQTLTVTGDDVTASAVDKNNNGQPDIKKVGGVGTTGGFKFEVGAEIGTSGIGNDDIQSTTIFLNADENITISDVDTVAIRATSVERNGGARTGSGFLVGEPPEQPPANPAIAIDKEGSLDLGGDGDADVGDVINYTFAVTNPGNVSLSNVTVTDPLVTNIAAVDADSDGFNDGDADEDGQLDVNETWQFTGSYAITQDDIDAGQVLNTATATGTPPAGGTVTDTDDNTETVPQGAAIEVDKEGSLDLGGDGVADPGDIINYTFAVTNPGNVSLSNVAVTDPLVTNIVAVDADSDGFNDGDADEDGQLDVDETWQFTGSYAITQDDIDAGQVLNTATATGTPPAGGTVTDTDDNTETVPQGAAIEVDKEGSLNLGDDDDADVGDVINYTFAVTNPGNVSLSNVTVTDPLVTNIVAVDADSDGFNDGDADEDGQLDVDETWQFTGSYAITQEDIDAGQVLNTATATGTPPAGGTVTDTDDETVPLPDDAPVVGARDIAVDEDFLTIGNQDLPVPSPGDDGGTASASDTFPINFGSDFAGATISFAALHGLPVTDTSAAAVTTSDGNLPLTYFWDAATNTLYGSTDPTDATTAAATAAFTLQVTNPDIGNESGSFVFTMNTALEHGQGVTPNTEDPNIDLALDYVATDADGDTAPGTLGVTIDDDIPIRAAAATPIAATVEEDGMSIVGGDPGGLNGPDQSEGNKDATDTNEDDQKTSVIAGSLAALVAVGADVPPTFGLDSDTSGLPELFSKGDAVTYTTSDSDADGTLDTLVGSADGRTVFTLHVNTDGTWEFDLDDQLDHVDDGADDENVDLVTTAASVPAIDFSSVINVTDSDGDTVKVLVANDFTIAVEDDIPELTDAENLIVQNVVGSEGTASGQATISVGADEPASFIVTQATGVEGVDYTISADGKTVTGHSDLDGDGTIEAGEDLYTFTIDDTGAYTFQLLAPLPAPDPVVFSAAGIASGDYASLTLTNSGLQLVIDAETAAGANTTLQVSQAAGGGIGVVQNTIENEESVTFSFEDSGGNEVAASQFTVTIKDDAGAPDYVWTATLEDGTTVVLDDGGAANSGGADVTYAAFGSGDLIATVELASGERFTDVQLQVVGNQNDKAKLGLEGFSFTPDTPDLDVAFDIQATDFDGDSATLQVADYDTDGDLDSLQVHIEADGDPTTLADAAIQTYLQSVSSSV